MKYSQFKDLCFPQVSTKSDAPMGRANCTEGFDESKMYNRKMFINSGGYDLGGAYWGVGKPMYCLFNTSGYRVYYREGEMPDYVKKHFAESKKSKLFTFKQATYLMQNGATMRVKNADKYEYYSMRGINLYYSEDNINWEINKVSIHFLRMLNYEIV